MKAYTVWRALVACTALLAACGDDDGGGAPKKATPANGQAAAATGPVVGKALVLQRMVEERVNCPGPKDPDEADRCDAKESMPCVRSTLKDAKKKYCLAAENTNTYCAPCNERDSIRHAFKDRDFVAEQNRDPFQSFVLVPVGVGTGDKLPTDATTPPKCNDRNSFAGSYSYQDLKLVGIETQGTQRKGLMTGGRASYIIRRNDCVGKERALVKEVGDGYITFVSQPDPNAVDSQPQEFSTQLHQNALALNLTADEAPIERPAPTAIPVPTKTAPAPKAEAPAPTKIQIPTPTAPGPATAPTQLNP